MKDLKDIRARIDGIDKEFSRLFLERMDAYHRNSPTMQP